MPVSGFSYTDITRLNNLVAELRACLDAGHGSASITITMYDKELAEKADRGPCMISVDTPSDAHGRDCIIRRGDSIGNALALVSVETAITSSERRDAGVIDE